MINDMIRQKTITFGLPVAAQSEGSGVSSTNNYDLNFKNIFEKTITEKSAEDHTRNQQCCKSSKTESDNSEVRKSREVNKETVKAEKPDDKECVRKTDKEAAGEVVGEKGNETAEESVKVSDDNSANSNGLSVINLFAGILGMQPDEFTVLLESSGISVDELSTAGIENITAKFTAAAGLSPELKNALSELLNMAADKLSRNPDTGVPADGTASIKIKASGTDTADGSTNFKASLKVMVQGSMQQGDSFSTAIAKLKIKLKEQNAKTSQESAGGVLETATVSDTVTGVVSMKADESTASELSTAANNENQDKEAEEVEKKPGVYTSDANTEASTAVESNDTGTVNTLNLSQVQKSDISSILEKTDLKVSVQAKEIINQVVEKAKIVNTPGKSEIIMDLKPESLGRLSLKVVTEQGIMVAKFIAESEQVKQILETNMQLLKDSLEKQGMNVQGFSVSVRQDNSYSSGKQYDNQANGRKAALRSVAINMNKSNMFIQGDVESISGNSLYRFGSSTINITA